jgi:hypothetical protein
MAPSKKDKTKAKKSAGEKKSSDNAEEKEVVKDAKKSKGTPSSENKRSTKTPSSEKSTKDKRRKSSSSSSSRKKQKQHSSLRPVKVRLMEGDDDSSYTNKEAGEETEDDAVIESLTKTPTRNRESALESTHDTNSNSTPTNQEEAGPSPAELRVALADTAERLQRAEKQVRAISRTRIADSFQEGQVRLWTKENLWKQVKFITNDRTMNKIMTKAAKHFKVPDEEREHWMSTFAHIVRDGLNQKRNACSQDLRKTLKSKYKPGLHIYQTSTSDSQMQCITIRKLPEQFL